MGPEDGVSLLPPAGRAQSEQRFSVNIIHVFLVSLNLPEEEKKKKVVRLPVQRSVETGLAVEFKSRFTRQPSRDPDAEDPKPGAYESLPVTLDPH